MNNSDLTSKYNNSSTGLFKDNTSGDIGANDARSLVVDIAASFINNETDFEKYVRQGTSAGTDAYSVTVSSASNVYAAATLFIVSFTNGSTAAVTLNVNGGGAKKVYIDPTTQAGSGDITANAAYLLRYYSTLDGGSGGFLMIGGPGGSGGGSQNLSSVLTQGNDAAGLNITNLSGPSASGDAATKGYVDGQVSGVTPTTLAAVLAEGNDADGTTITNLPTPSAGSDAATKTYVDGVASGSTQLADFTAVSDAAPLAADCNSLKEPKFYTALANSRTIDLTNVRAVSNNNQYVTLFWIFKKTVAGDLVVTLDADSSFNNKDLATDASATSYTLSGASNTYFKLTGIFHGEASGCIVWWNLVTVSAAGSATWGALTGTITDQTDLVAYITGLLDGLKWKPSVKVATTTNGTLATAYENGDTVDGITLATGDRILIKNQTTQSENGIYTVNASGAPTRASDANVAAELEGATVTVQQGTSNANTTWTQTTDGITLGSSNIVWAQFGTSVADADSTTKGIAKLYNTSGTNTDGAITQGAAKTADDLRLPLAGGSMTGAIAMGTNKITGLAAATASGDAMRYEQVVGVQDLFIPAAAFWPTITNGCSSLTQSGISTVNIKTLDFDQTTQQFAQCQIVLQRKWNNGTVTAVIYWTATDAGSGGVQWGVSGAAFRDDDALSASLGTAQTVDDTLLATNDMHITSATSAITLSGTLQDANLLVFQVSRNPAAAGDTLPANARFLGISIRLTTDAGIDA